MTNSQVHSTILGDHDTMIEALCDLILPEVPSLHTTGKIKSTYDLPR